MSLTARAVLRQTQAEGARGAIPDLIVAADEIAPNDHPLQTQRLAPQQRRAVIDISIHDSQWVHDAILGTISHGDEGFCSEQTDRRGHHRTTADQVELH
ncbi:MAG: hypothetical protein L0J19_07360 [Brevibacterium sp.]|nr:hypothetical protein [Brevibacterium sp.]MDN6188600.1 hypothetical protein [Brevibacterium sp.]